MSVNTLIGLRLRQWGSVMKHDLELFFSRAEK
jgi:hypothetical protein